MSLVNGTQNLAVDAVHGNVRRWILPAFFLGWTILAVVVAWWLIHSAGAERLQPELLFDSSQGSQLSVGQQVHRWLRIADLNFRGTYPWILLAPYVLWLASIFHLEQGRLRISLPVHLAACALFAAASFALTRQMVEKMNVVMVVSDREHRIGSAWEIFTNRLGAGLEGMIDDRAMTEHARTSHIADFRTKIIMSAGGAVETFELPPLTNQIVTSTNLRLPEGVVTHRISKAGPPSITAQAGNGGGFMGAGGGAGFSSAHTSWRYESRLFSHLLNVLAYCSLAGLAHAVHFYRRFRERERRAVWLESNLAQARVHALQAQLQPHFLFNALNAVATLLRRDARAAGEALTSFSELLRLALSQSDKQEVPLREDLQFVERYIEIQQTRLGDRLRFEQEVEPATLDCLVPALFLQPLVENALRHGIEPSSHPGVVRITVKRQDSTLSLSIEDNGVGLPPGQTEPREGIGLSNLRARLKALYGTQQKVELIPRAEGGVTVRLEIPLRHSAAAHGVGWAHAV